MFAIIFQLEDTLFLDNDLPLGPFKYQSGQSSLDKGQAARTFCCYKSLKHAENVSDETNSWIQRMIDVNEDGSDYQIVADPVRVGTIVLKGTPNVHLYTCAWTPIFITIERRPFTISSIRATPYIDLMLLANKAPADMCAIYRQLAWNMHQGDFELQVRYCLNSDFFTEKAFIAHAHDPDLATRIVERIDEHFREHWSKKNSKKAARIADEATEKAAEIRELWFEIFVAVSAVGAVIGVILNC